MIYFNSREHWGNTNSFIWTFSAIFPNFKKNLNNWYSPLLLFGNFPELSPERIHNHEVPSSILGPATRKYSRSLCFFRLYALKPSPRSGLDIDISGAESLLSKRQKWQWTEVSEANEGLMAARIKTSQGFLKQLSWVQCDRTERIRRSPSGDWNILRPATRKSSTYETFVSAFFFVGNFRGTWKFWISFSFHYFHR